MYEYDYQKPPADLQTLADEIAADANVPDTTDFRYEEADVPGNLTVFYAVELNVDEKTALDAVSVSCVFNYHYF